MSLNILNPLSFNKTIIDFDSAQEFKKLSNKHKVITVMAVATLGTLSLVLAGAVFQRWLPNFISNNSNKIVTLVVSIVGIAKIILLPYLQILVGRFRALEDNCSPLKPFEVAFYAWITSKQKLISSLIIKGRNNEKTKEVIADCILLNYIDSVKEQKSDFLLSEDEKRSLIASLIEQMGNSAQAGRPIAISQTKQLTPFKTKDDGSCGFHALIGEPDETGTYRCDASTKRDEFCSWLIIEWNKCRLPTKIQEVLIDYFNHFDLAPSIFTHKAKNKYNSYHTPDWNKLSEAERDERKKQFVNDPEVFTAYLHNFRLVGTYLLPEELFTVAEWYKKDLIVYHKMGTEIAIMESERIHGDTVYILFEGAHFERALVEPV